MEHNKTRVQREYEQRIEILSRIMAELSEEQQTKVFDYAINTYNKSDWHTL